MYSEEDFKVASVSDGLESFKAGHRVSLSDTSEVVMETIQSLVHDLKVAPNVCNRVAKTDLTFYRNNDGQVVNIRLLVQPRTKYRLAVDEMRLVYEFLMSDDITTNIADSMAAWADRYIQRQMLQSNLNELNAEVCSLMSAADVKCPFSVSFGMIAKEVLIDISDNHIVLGISANTIMSLDRLTIFAYKGTEIPAYSRCVNEFVNALAVCTAPRQVFALKKLSLFKELGIKFHKISQDKAIRRCFNRSADVKRTGAAYVQSGNIFAVVSRNSITAEEAEAVKSLDMPESLRVVVEIPDNTLRVAERKEGRIFMDCAYIVSPFDMNTEEGVNVAIKDLLGV